jgi:homoserine O-acetyltransferase
MNHLLAACVVGLLVAGRGEAREEGLKMVKAPMLLLPAKNDMLPPPDMARRVRDIVQADGGKVEYAEIVGEWGHLDGIVNIAQAGDKIKAFLAK